MDFRGFHIAFDKGAGLFCDGIVRDQPGNRVQVYVGGHGGKDKVISPITSVTEIHVTIGGHHHAAERMVLPDPTSKALDDAVVRFVNEQLEKGPMGLAFLQSLYAYCNNKPALSFRMSTVYNSIHENLRKAVKQQG